MFDGGLDMERNNPWGPGGDTGLALLPDDDTPDLVLPPADGEIPAGLDEMVPGPVLGVILSSLDRSRLSGRDLVTVLKAEAKMTAHYQALSFQSMVEVSNRTVEAWGDYPETAETASDEIRAALALTRRSADIEMGLAHALRTDHPRVWEALSSGLVDLRRARVIVDEVTGLGPGQADDIVSQVIDTASTLTTGELRGLLGRLVIDIDPDAAQTRYELSVDDRRVFSEVNPAGTGNLMGLDLPIARAQWPFLPHRVPGLWRIRLFQAG